MKTLGNWRKHKDAIGKGREKPTLPGTILTELARPKTFGCSEL
jgi:hypothetical protein